MSDMSNPQADDLERKHRRQKIRLKAERDEARAALLKFSKTTDSMRQAEIEWLERYISEMGPLPLPSPELRLHVGAKTTASNFLAQGRASSQRVIELFGDNPQAPILDWGCGSGRTLRWLMTNPQWLAMYRGVDVDPAAIKWLKDNKVANVKLADAADIALPYADGEVAGIFSFSVLTHIHPKHFRAWLTELARVMRPGGLAYLTFQGDGEEITTPAHCGAQFREEGWTWIEHDGHYKCAAFVTHPFMEEAARGLFRVKKIVKHDYAKMHALYGEKI